MAQFQVQIVAFPPPPPPPLPLLPFHPGSLSTSHVHRLKVCNGVGEQQPSLRSEVSSVCCRWNLSAEQILHLRSACPSHSPSRSSLCASPVITATEVGVDVHTPQVSSKPPPGSQVPAEERFLRYIFLQDEAKYSLVMSHNLD